MPLTSDDLMILRGGGRAALVSGSDGHRFLAEEQSRDYAEVAACSRT
jgi:hypothetical protein